MAASLPDYVALEAVRAEVVACQNCERLVAWRNAVAERPPAAHAGARYWARPIPSFGDPEARLVLVGLAPAAHGGNRTGRMFTGDRSGDFLFAALHRAGYASLPTSTDADDGLELHGALVTAAVRCAPPANRPTPAEARACAPYLARELAALRCAAVLVCLGGFAFAALRREPTLIFDGGRAPRFSHGAEAPAQLCGRPVTVLCSYHPSQRNVFTGRLRPEMLDAVLARATALGAAPGQCRDD